MPPSEGREGDQSGGGATADGGFERLDEPRGDRTREWELFVRESSEEPLRHAGSVSAPTAEVAREQATTLFGFAAETLWLCPADETVRLVAADVALGDRAREYETGGDPEEADRDSDAGDAGGAGPESDDGRAES